MRLGLFAVLALATLVALWIGLRPSAPPASQVSLAVPSVADAPAPVAPALEPLRWRIDWPAASGAPPAVLRAQVGDQLELTVVSARDDELHLHGYDLTLALQAGQPGTLQFPATHAGRFEIELHRGHAAIGVLEVQPR